MKKTLLVILVLSLVFAAFTKIEESKIDKSKIIGVWTINHAEFNGKPQTDLPNKKCQEELTEYLSDGTFKSIVMKDCKIEREEEIGTWKVEGKYIISKMGENTPDLKLEIQELTDVKMKLYYDGSVPELNSDTILLELKRYKKE
ncbi:lipocalin family protein [Aureivirga sp. CE67]|uniref:lipocalin family protein n=1 Tax=Aureivirga sp. CE67 TaxID=1788983 RepID=UPI0018CA9ADB|nr:lipocalin family protein [Aureivirga sp. CE67]